MNNPQSNAPMITTLNAYATSIQNDLSRPVRRSSNLIPYSLISPNSPNVNLRTRLNSRTNSIYPAYTPTRSRTSTLNRAIPENDRNDENVQSVQQMVRNLQNVQNDEIVQNIQQVVRNDRNAQSNTVRNIVSSNSSTKYPSSEVEQLNERSRRSSGERKIESVTEHRENVDRMENDVFRANSVTSEENLNDFEYDINDQFYYYNREQHEPASNQVNQPALNDNTQQNQTLAEIDHQQHLESMSNEPSKSGHDQTNRASLDEFDVMYEDFKKIKKLGYDYNYYE